MNIGTASTRIKYALGAYSEEVLAFLNDPYIWHHMDQAVLEIKQELQLPISETDLVCTVGERGLNFESDYFLSWPDEVHARFIDADDSANSEGIPFRILSEHQLGA